jgi:hypothetical protein
MWLLYDTAANAEILRVTATGTATNIPVAKFARAHSGGATFGKLQLTPTYVGIERVPNAPAWGF